MEKKLLLMSTDNKIKFAKMKAIFEDVAKNYTTTVNTHGYRTRYYVYAYVTKPDQAIIEREVGNIGLPEPLKKRA